MFRKLFLFFFLLAFAFFSRSQVNLVPNGSFEKFKNKSKLLTNALPWKNFNSADYYREPIKNDTSKFKGAHTGVAYGGLRFQRDYRELPYVKLSQPLKANTKYKFEMYIRLAYWSNVALQSFGVNFSKNLFKTSDKIDSANSVMFYNKKGVYNKSNWMKITGFYTAVGGEKYMTIGNYVLKLKKDFYRLHPFKFEFVKSEAYYFIDDISLSEAKDTSSAGGPKEGFTMLVDTVFKPNRTFDINTPVVLNNIMFEPGKAELMIESLDQLDRFVKYLDDHPDAEVAINAHVDALTPKAKRVAKARAAVIVEYLVSNNTLNKLYYKGFGSSVPIGDNTTEEGRNKNNRIEFVIIK